MKWLRPHRLLRLFTAQKTADSAAEGMSARAARYWNDWQREHDASAGRWHDWSEHPVILRLIQEELFGSPEVSVFDYLKRRYPAFASARALSLCSGDGGFERRLVEHGVFAHITGIDLADERVAAAAARHGDLGDRLAFTTGDVNGGRFGSRCHDVVLAKAALHHVEKLEALFEGIGDCLKPGGCLVTIDFFGPTRFQWDAAQLRHADAFLAQIPPALRRRGDGSLKERADRPSVTEMIATDPSEAVRSAEILGFIRRHFRQVEEVEVGGTLLNLIFTPDILNNFEPGDPEHEALMARAFQRERELLERGELACDFKLVVAR